MLRFPLFGIPVMVDLWFWISAVILAGGASANSPGAWSRVAVVCAVIFLSILVHELGHAISGRGYGASPAIKLHAFGGLTFFPGSSFSRRQNILVTAAGPLAGFLLGLVFLGVSLAVQVEEPLVRIALSSGFYINFVWTFFNLLPIQPLDGGQIMREILGPTRRDLSCMIGGILAVVVCAWSLSRGQIYMALMLAMMAYQNFRRQPMADV